MPLGSCHASGPACFSVWLNFYSLPMKFLCREGKCSYRHRSEFISYHLVYGIFKDSALLAIIYTWKQESTLGKAPGYKSGEKTLPCGLA